MWTWCKTNSESPVISDAMALMQRHGNDEMSGNMLSRFTNIPISVYTKYMAFYHMMTSSDGNIFRVTGPVFGEFTGHR